MCRIVLFITREVQHIAALPLHSDEAHDPQKFSNIGF